MRPLEIEEINLDYEIGFCLGQCFDPPVCDC
jgi:hypothetical protein